MKKVEVKLAELLLSSDPSCVFPVDKGSQDKLKMLMTLLPKHYLLEVMIYKSPKNNALTACKTQDSLIPKITLSEYLEKLNKGDVEIDPSPFDAKIRFFDLSYYETANDLEKMFIDIKEEFYIEVDKNNKIKM